MHNYYVWSIFSPLNCAIVFRIHPPKCRKNNALYCCFQLRNMLKNPCWKKQLELIWCWKLSNFLIASSNAILISEKWVGDGKLHLNFLWACPFGALILAVLAVFGPSWPLLALWAPSWPYKPLLAFWAPSPCWSPFGLLSPYWPLGPLLVFLASLCIFKSLRSLSYNLDARNHEKFTSFLLLTFWLCRFFGCC